MFNTDKYLELLKQYPPRLIRNKKELEDTEKVVNSLLDKLELDKLQLTIEEREYLSVLAVLIYEYEEKNQELIPDIYGIELLKTILGLFFVKIKIRPKVIFPKIYQLYIFFSY